MLNLKNNKNDAVFVEICKKNKKKQKNKEKIKIKFQKMEGTFLDSIPWLKSHQAPPVCVYVCTFVQFYIGKEFRNSENFHEFS